VKSENQISTEPRKESQHSGKEQQICVNGSDAEKCKKEEQSKIKSETKKQSDEIKLVDKIDIDKPDDENLEKLRKNN